MALGPCNNPERKGPLLIYYDLSIIEKRQVSTTNKTCFRSPFVNQSTPSVAAKGNIVLLTFWDRSKLNLQWKETKSFLLKWNMKIPTLWIQTLLCTVASPVYFDFEQKRAIPGRHHYCPIQNHIRPKKAPLQLNIDSNGLVFKHSTMNLIHEKQHFFHWNFHIVYLHSQRWAFCNSFLVWEFHVEAISAVTIICNRVKWCDLVPNLSVHSFTPTLLCSHLLHDILSAISFWII